MKYFIFMLVFCVVCGIANAGVQNYLNTADSSQKKEDWLLNLNIHKFNFNLLEKQKGFPRALTFQITTDFRLYKRIYGNLYIYPTLGYANQSDYLEVNNSHNDFNLFTKGIGLQYNFFAKAIATTLGIGVSLNQYKFWGYAKNGSNISKSESKSDFQRIEIIANHGLNKRCAINLGFLISHQPKGVRLLPNDFTSNLFVGFIYNILSK